MKKCGGLREYNFCLLVFKESCFPMPPSDSCRQQKIACVEEVELPQSYLATVRTEIDALQERHRSIIQRISDLEETLRGAREEECQLKRDVEPKSLKLQAVESEADVKSQTLADLEAVPSLSPNDVLDLERHEQAMLDIQSSLNPDMWMNSA